MCVYEVPKVEKLPEEIRRMKKDAAPLPTTLQLVVTDELDPFNSIDAEFVARYLISKESPFTALKTKFMVLNSSILEAFSPIFSLSSRINSVEFSHGALGEDGVRVLAAILQRHRPPNLLTLNLADNGIGAVCCPSALLWP